MATQIKSLNSDIKDNKDKLNAAEKAVSQIGNEIAFTKVSLKLSEGFPVRNGVIIKKLQSYLNDWPRFSTRLGTLEINIFRDKTN